ncbi:MAG: hypothetical protein APF76_13365 [Desulfitibacter sp. BRH_c19]|nr:MAG: hypothetical protein APF76_13365 [Desulfitibacter sp. BRH_c19]
MGQILKTPKSDLLFKSSAGHEVHRHENNIFIRYNKEMLAFSTSQLNGGINKIDYSFNHQLSKWIETVDDLPGGSLKNYLAYNSEILGLEGNRSTGLITSASMDNVAIIHEVLGDASLFAVVTGGASVNAARAGDSASYDETSFGRFVPVAGTINIMLVLEFSIPVEGLARTAIVVTEAKTAAMQELNVKSCFSEGVATGTGTDGLIAACHNDDEYSFSDVGTHSRLGELISRIVKKGVTEALIKDGIEGVKTR